MTHYLSTTSYVFLPQRVNNDLNVSVELFLIKKAVDLWRQRPTEVLARPGAAPARAAKVRRPERPDVPDEEPAEAEPFRRRRREGALHRQL